MVGSGVSNVDKCGRLSQPSWLLGALQKKPAYLLTYLLTVVVTSVVDPRLYGLRISADRMADCTQKLEATISAAVES